MLENAIPQDIKQFSKFKRYFRIGIKVCLSIIVTLLISGLGYWFWYFHRSQPSPISREIFKGVTYIRDVIKTPRPNVCHLLIIDLKSPGIHFLVTPGDVTKPRPLKAMVTSDFLSKYRLQAAINADFFFPWHSKSPWDYYPHVGDSVELEGTAISNGTLYSNGGKKSLYPSLSINEKIEAVFDILQDSYNLVSGDHMFIVDGKFGKAPSSYHTTPQPRTAVALNKEATKMIWIVVDGRQPSYSDGMTMKELADVLVRYGAYNALNLDGGGSSEMVIQGKNGNPEILNCPIDVHIPGRERPVANHLGIYAEPIQSK